MKADKMAVSHHYLTKIDHCQNQTKYVTGLLRILYISFLRSICNGERVYNCVIGLSNDCIELYGF